MLVTFGQALETLDQDAVMTIAREAKPPARYYLATILPEMLKPTYHVEAGSITIRSLMAGVVGMDSPYPETGFAAVSRFLEQSAKLANKATLSEKAQRDIQATLRQLDLPAAGQIQSLAQDALNFLNKVLLQGHFDRTEWLRAQALVFGAIDWGFSGITIAVDYGVPVGNFLASRPIAGAATAYGAANSLFWSDIRQLNQILRRNVRVYLLNSTTLDVIVNNEANNIQVLSDTGGMVRLRRLRDNGAGSFVLPSSDSRDTVELVTYDEEGEIPDLANPGDTIRVPFIPDGKLVAIGQNAASSFRPGQGSTDDPAEARAIGYTHIAPTVEGNGAMGRWSRIYVPQERPYQLAGECVANLLPVLTAPQKVAVATTEMP